MIMHIPFLNKKLSPKHNQNKALRSGRVYIHKEKIDLRKIAKQYESCDFSHCDLSSITLPQKGHYLFFDDWDKQLEEIKRNATGEEKQVIKEEIEEFTGIHKIYSESQKCYIINVEDLN